MASYLFANRTISTRIHRWHLQLVQAACISTQSSAQKQSTKIILFPRGPQRRENAEKARALEEARVLAIPRVLEEVLSTLTPRAREVFTMVTTSGLTIEEMCVKLRPPPDKPLHSASVVSHVWKVLTRAPRSADEEQALYHAVGGKSGLAEFTKRGDPYHWAYHNAYQSYTTRRSECQALANRHKEYKDFFSSIVKGEVDAADWHERRKAIFEYSIALKKVPRAILSHLIKKEGLAKASEDELSHLAKRGIIHRPPVPTIGKVDEEADRRTREVLKIVRDMALYYEIGEVEDRWTREVDDDNCESSYLRMEYQVEVVVLKIDG
ncbi:hypothetical protein BDP27DRAFT_1420539 [Rhodocollybia butyracea]|uniref:Uncharacterized protein n=1 Tax=Rhodocollybia butyracea TaxID=206335 RepID=A0A9P5PVE5_9AGAR|nr:hypothetical protein BDP27DRAFT_1420539 [Rhodocollybia butyracea]